MKKSLLVIGLALSSIATVNAFSLSSNAVFSIVGEDKKVELDAAKFPASLVTAVTKSNPNAKIEKVYELRNEKNELTGYEVNLSEAGKNSIVTVDKTGTVVNTQPTAPVAPATKVDSIKAK